jgi:hypothetical protein
MGKKLNIYNLADIGVDVTASPLHRKPGTLTKAQNAVMLPNEAEGAIEKRGGLQAIGDDLTQHIWGGANIPLNPATVQRLWVALEDTSVEKTWIHSIDGTTWLVATIPAAAFQAQRRKPSYHHLFQPPATVAIVNRMIYPSDAYAIYEDA